MAWLELDKLLWPENHPYSWPTIGSMEDLNAATVDDVRTFYERYYVPNNATIVIAGDVTVDEVRKLVEQYFGDIPRGPEMPALPPPTPTPRTDGERRVTVEDRLATLPLIAMGFNIPPHDHADTYALQLLSSIFSEGESSRLHRRLVKEEGAALQVLSGLNSRMGPGAFMFYALPNQGVDTERLEALIAEEIQKLKDEGVTERELQKAKNQLRAELVRELKTVSGKANRIGFAEVVFGDYHAFGRVESEWEKVGPEDVRRVVGKYLGPEQKTVVTLDPIRPGGAKP